MLLSFVERIFRHQYAPLAYKQAAGWDLDESLAKLRSVLLREQPPSTHEVQRALYRLFRSPRDIHTGVFFKEAKAVWLGLHLRRAGDHYVVAWIDRSVLPVERYPIAVGDRVVEFDGRGTEQAVRAVEANTLWRSTPGFAQRFAEWFLIFRSTTEWDEIPAPGQRLKLTLALGGARRRSVELPWRDADSEQGEPPQRRCSFWGRTKRGFLPDLGRVVWRAGSGETVNGYTFEADASRYGYMRVHTYQRSGEAASRAIGEFDRMLDAFQQRDIKGLVVDQTGNGGGSFPFGLAMFSRVSERPLVAPSQRFLRGQDGRIVGYPGSGALGETREALRKLSSERAASEAFETVPLLGLVRYLPHTLATVNGLSRFLAFVSSSGQPAVLTEPHYQVVPEYPREERRGEAYTGPIVMLIDELNISAAEYVAAGLADQGRAVLFGETTAGAGGDQRTYVPGVICGRSSADDPLQPCVSSEVSRAMQRFGVAGASFTMTLGQRTGSSAGRPIENVGVAPSVSYELQAEDMTHDFSAMRRRILATLQHSDRTTN